MSFALVFLVCCNRIAGSPAADVRDIRLPPYENLGATEVAQLQNMRLKTKRCVNGGKRQRRIREEKSEERRGRVNRVICAGADRTYYMERPRSSNSEALRPAAPVIKFGWRHAYNSTPK